MNSRRGRSEVRGLESRYQKSRLWVEKKAWGEIGAQKKRALKRGEYKRSQSHVLARGGLSDRGGRMQRCPRFGKKTSTKKRGEVLSLRYRQKRKRKNSLNWTLRKRQVKGGSRRLGVESLKKAREKL